MVISLPAGCAVLWRSGNPARKYHLPAEFSGEAKTITLAERYTDLLTSELCTGMTEIPVNGMLVMQKSST